MIKKLLLVDDEQDIREILYIYLVDAGYEVLMAEDGIKALEVFKKEKPPIVITDIKMSGMDGISLLKNIKKEVPDTEVIMLTGHGDLDLAIKSLKYEATDFITKPINIDILELSLNRAYEKASMREEIRAHNENLHRLVKEELRAARHKYQLLFESSPCFISVQSKELIITESNRLFREHFGDKSGKYCYEAYKQRTDPCPDCPVVLTFEDGKSHSMESVVKSKTGVLYNVLITTAPIRDKNGNITHVMEMSTDITTIRKLQDQLTSLGLLIGTVSHSIKGMLTGLDAGMYMLKSGLLKNDQKQIQESYGLLRQMVGRIRKQVLDILYYAKNRELEYEKLNIAEFANDISISAEQKAKDNNIEFIRDFQRVSNEFFTIDPEVAGSAIINILENAVEACIEDKSSKKHKVYFTIKTDEKNIIFIIEDNGTGMDKETKDKIFTLFFSSKGNKGTGLGLFIAGQMIERHGGEIKVESDKAGGSSFFIKLPKNPPEKKS